ncbi:hypothetical protein [Pseudonocardia sp. GCM10023141]|uniref:hypothetical protein n=1 Tax=Pseudonocardia sp. GCM10023141 TaxID=3252653 RepID=UPI00360FD6FF
MADYEDILPRGDERVAQALISRHNVRMGNTGKIFDDYRFAVMSAMVPVLQIDKALRALGENPRRPPTLHAGSAVDRLSWGVDSVISAARLLLSGQILGAAAMVRNQLERWVSQRAANIELEQRPGESTAAFVARVWSHPDEFHEQWYEKHVEVFANFYEDGNVGSTDEHLHVYRSDGSDVCPAATYELLSELLHLRVLDEVHYWDAELLAQDDLITESLTVAAWAVCDGIFLALREIRLSAIRLAEKRGFESLVEYLSNGMDAISISDQQTDLDFEAIPFGHARAQETEIPPLSALAPLLPREGLAPRMVSAVEALAGDFEAVLMGGRPAGRLYVDDELLVRAFCWHRQRSINLAIHGLATERELMGADFNIDSLAGRSSKWIILTEATSLLAVWHQVPGVKRAASALASSLRSAYWLWLEDDDRAMAILRSSLEYVARLRTWRRKPSKAEVLESRPQSTPRDWIYEAGWKRLNLLNRALGEFAHARKIEEWPSARQILAELQLNVDEERAIYTARGAAIDFIASLAAREVVALIAEVSAEVAAAVGGILKGLEFELDERAADVEAQFAHIWSMQIRRS